MSTTPAAQPAHDAADPARPPSLARSLLKLARPRQWAKSVFCFIGPFYALKALLGSGIVDFLAAFWPAIIAAAAFALASSGCYVFNDIADREADRAHPRKRRRPIASGAVTPRQGAAFGLGLMAAAFALLLAIPVAEHALWVGVALALHVANILTYSYFQKHHVIADVISLSLGFVLRVLAGCAAVWVVPSTWLLNVTFFLAMFLAFGKRLGERRALTAADGDAADAGRLRAVQRKYSDQQLEMAVVVTGVATLMTYAFYVQDQESLYTQGFNLLWITILPATFGLLRAIVLLDRGAHDDPTELAVHDRPTQLAVLLFAAITIALTLWFG